MEEDKRKKISHMEYMEGMEQIQSDIFEKVITARKGVFTVVDHRVRQK